MSRAARSRGRLPGATLVAVVIGLGAWLVPATAAHHGPADAHESSQRRVTAPYRGLATWVDIQDARPWDRPRATVREMSGEGVHTVFVQTANYSAPRSLYRPAALGRLITAAHAHGMSVVGWYLPSFAHPDVDLRRSMAVIGYRTASGERFDGFGLDIEANVVSPVARRVRAMLRLSHRIRAAVGRPYSLGAITPSPRGMKRAPAYWGPLREFPFAALARIYDVIAPMGYFTYRTRGGRAAHDYTTFNIEAVRRLSGRPRLPVHPVGGLGGQASRDEVRAYVRALRESAVLGGSLYDFVSTTPGQWRELRRVPGCQCRKSAL